jgi:hypothetical protein
MTPTPPVDSPTINGASVLDKVRQLIQEAENAGVPTPGRPTLVDRTGATEHQVRRALAELAMAGDGPPPATTSGVVEVTADTASDEPGYSVNVEADEPLATTSVNAGEPGGRFPRSWPLIVIGVVGAVAVWSGWVSIGHLTGFGVVEPLPGIVDGFKINTAVLLPIGIEAYGGYALRVWLTSARLQPKTVAFARRSSLASLAIGAGAQVASHLMTAAGVTTAPWPITMAIACVPVALVGLAAALARLVANDRQAGENR